MDFDDFSMLRSLNSVINFGLFACLIGAILTLIVPYAIQSEKDEDTLYQKIEEYQEDGWKIYRKGEYVTDLNLNAINLEEYEIVYDSEKESIYLR